MRQHKLLVYRLSSSSSKYSNKCILSAIQFQRLPTLFHLKILHWWIRTQSKECRLLKKCLLSLLSTLYSISLLLIRLQWCFKICSRHTKVTLILLSSIIYRKNSGWDTLEIECIDNELGQRQLYSEERSTHLEQTHRGLQLKAPRLWSVGWL